MAKAALVTGGTGFIGRFVVERLLTEGRDVALLVRPSARERRATVLDRLDAAAKAAESQLTVVVGDLASDPVTDADLSAFGDVFHLAAIYDLGAPRDAMTRANVEGTRRLLLALEAAGFAGTFHHVSSIAVAGDHTGPFRETDLDVGQRHPHPYQRSKLESEKLVRTTRAFAWRIYRPSAVVGHSETGEIDKLDGPYLAFPLVQQINRVIPDGFPLTGFRTRGRLNIVPVDYVADALVALARKPGLDGRCFHLVDPKPRPTIESFDAVMRAAGGPRFKTIVPTPLAAFVPGVGMLGKLGSLRMVAERLLEQQGVPTSVLDAMNDRTRFVCDDTLAALKDTGVRCPPFASYAPALWRYYVEHLDPRRDRTLRRREALAGKKVLITGASSGIGREAAKLAAAAGAHVLLVARREDRLAEMCDAIRAAGGAADFYVCDVGDLDACDRLVTQVLDDHGHLDVLVNNAAKSIRRFVTESFDRFHDYERTMKVNYFGALRLCLGFLPSMVERRSGHLIHSSTTGTWGPGLRFSAYIASKSAMDAFHSSVDAELADKGIRATSVHFPLVKTEMIAPTGDYEDSPMIMSAERAGAMLVDAMVERPRRVMRPLAYAMGLGSLMWPDVNTFLFNVIMHLWPPGEDEHPELAPDRVLLSPFIRSSPL